MATAEGLIAGWRERLGLGSWDIRYSALAPQDQDERASADIHTIPRRAVIRIDHGCPHECLEREVVHELLHVLMADMEDTAERARSGLGEEARAYLAGQWERSQEWAIERLADALTGTVYVEWPLAARAQPGNEAFADGFGGVPCGAASPGVPDRGPATIP